MWMSALFLPLIRVWGMSTISTPWEWKSRVTVR